MLPTVYINNHDLTVKEYQNQRVVTLKEIDEVHQRPEGTSRRNFNANRRRFIENEDYYSVQATTDEIRSQFGINKNAGKGLTLLTESGYLMLVKSFTDDLAWTVQRQLVNTYFRAKESQPSPQIQQNQIAALRLIADQLEMQNRRFDKIETRLEVIESRPQADENINKRIDELENRYASYSNIHFKPLKAKKYNVLEELLIEFPIETKGRLYLFTDDKKYNNQLMLWAKECIEEMKNTHLKDIYKIAAQFGKKNETRLVYYWNNNNSDKGFIDKDFIMTILCYNFEKIYRRGYSINGKAVS